MRAMGRHGVATARGVVLAGLALGGVGASRSAAQMPVEPGLAVTMEVDTTAIHLGDAVSVRLSVDHPSAWSVQWPDSLDVAPFEVLAYEVPRSDPSPSGEGVRSVAGLRLTAFELGELDIPPIAIPVTAPDGAVRTLLTDPHRIGVESVGLDESGDIRDIRGPLAIARNWWVLVPWLLLAAAAGAGALYVRRRLRARPNREVTAPRTPPRPFHLVALDALDELERSPLLERGRIKTWHVRISEIIRTYVEGQLGVPALEMTTPEVVAGLRAAALSGPISESFDSFLARCDLVKFAKLRPGADSSRELLGVARSLIEMTSGPERQAAGGEAPGGQE